MKHFWCIIDTSSKWYSINIDKTGKHGHKKLDRQNLNSGFTKLIQDNCNLDTMFTQDWQDVNENWHDISSKLTYTHKNRREKEGEKKKENTGTCWNVYLSCYLHVVSTLSRDYTHVAMEICPEPWYIQLRG